VPTTLTVNALAERIIDTALQSALPDDEYCSLQATPDETTRRLYRKIIRGETFGHQALKSAELRYLFAMAQDAYRSHNQLVSRSVLVTLLEITFELLACVVSRGIVVDEHYIQRIFDFSGQDYDAEPRQFLANLAPSIDSSYAEYLLRPLASDAIEITALPEEDVARICRLDRLRQVFPLLMMVNIRSERDRQAFMDDIRPVIDSHNETISVNDITLQIWVHGSKNVPEHELIFHAPRFGLILTANRFAYPVSWEVFCELSRLLKVHAALDVSHGWSHQGRRAGIFMPSGQQEEVIIVLDGLRFFMTRDEFTELADKLLTTLASAPLDRGMAQLQALYGDL
ncbi:TPA: hypothetical protein PXM28_004069, partial [Yersinia enterocolitica]|nr:hypothetical protein [Yersinia enterocolitica]